MPRVPPVTTATLPVRSNMSTPHLRRTGRPRRRAPSRQTIQPVAAADGHGRGRVCQPLTMIPPSTDAPAMGATSEVGRLRTVVLHRPGPELRRLTPRNNDDLLFDGVPWLDRAQHEHDQFAETLRAHDVEVLYLHELLTEVLEVPEARAELLDGALRPDLIGPALVPALREHLEPLPAAELACVLMAGMARDELPVHPGGLVEHMVEPQSFVIRPLPNLLFTRDSAVWLDHGVAVTQLAMPARRRESTITGAIYRHHPRFAGTELLYGGSQQDQAWLEGGDVLVLAPGVLAIGVGQRTSPAGVEAF